MCDCGGCDSGEFCACVTGHEDEPECMACSHLGDSDNPCDSWDWATCDTLYECESACPASSYRVVRQPVDSAAGWCNDVANPSCDECAKWKDGRQWVVERYSDDYQQCVYVEQHNKCMFKGWAMNPESMLLDEDWQGAEDCHMPMERRLSRMIVPSRDHSCRYVADASPWMCSRYEDGRSGAQNDQPECVYDMDHDKCVYKGWAEQEGLHYVDGC